MVVAQRALEGAEGSDLMRAQGAMKELRIIEALPYEIEYQIEQYEQETKREEMKAHA